MRGGEEEILLRPIAAGNPIDSVLGIRQYYEDIPANSENKIYVDSAVVFVVAVLLWETR
jgi:hypothetical protein